MRFASRAKARYVSPAAPRAKNIIFLRGGFAAGLAPRSEQPAPRKRGGEPTAQKGQGAL